MNIGWVLVFTLLPFYFVFISHRFAPLKTAHIYRYMSIYHSHSDFEGTDPMLNNFIGEDFHKSPGMGQKILGPGSAPPLAMPDDTGDLLPV